MANREHRNSREKRKPKAEKPKLAPAQASPFAHGQGKDSSNSKVTKKGR
jgi:hypothetical protein